MMCVCLHFLTKHVLFEVFQRVFVVCEAKDAEVKQDSVEVQPRLHVHKIEFWLPSIQTGSVTF